MPFELRPYPSDTLRPEGEYLQRAWAERVLPLAARMGLQMVLPRVSPQPHTRLAFEGFQYAKEHGKPHEYNHEVFKAFFQEEQDIGGVEVLTRIAGNAGLDAADFRHALETRAYKDAHQRALAGPAKPVSRPCPPSSSAAASSPASRPAKSSSRSSAKNRAAASDLRPQHSTVVSLHSRQKQA